MKRVFSETSDKESDEGGITKSAAVEATQAEIDEDVSTNTKDSEESSEKDSESSKKSDDPASEPDCPCPAITKIANAAAMPPPPTPAVDVAAAAEVVQSEVQPDDKVCRVPEVEQKV